MKILKIYLIVSIIFYISVLGFADDQSGVNEKSKAELSLMQKYSNYLVPKNEIINLRNSTTQHYRINDSTYIAIISSEPIFHQDQDGNWLPIGNSISPLLDHPASASGRIFKSSGSATPIKESSVRLRIQNQSSTGCTYGYRSWVKYDLKSLQCVKSINDVNQHLYSRALVQNAPLDYLEYDVYQLISDPVTSSASEVWDDIADGTLYENNELVTSPPGDEWSNIPATTVIFNSRYSPGWFGLGYMVDCNENNSNFYAEFDQLGASIPPKLVIEYTAFPTPAKVTLSYPANGAVNIFPETRLEWNSVSDASYYIVEVDDDPNFGSPNYTAHPTSNIIPTLQNLIHCTTYYWRVRGVNCAASGIWSNTSSFTTVSLNFNISCTTNPSVGGTTSGCGTFQCKQTANLIATPNSCYNFVNWTENGQSVSTSPTYSFTVTTNRNLVANFTPKQYTISCSASPSGGGSTSGCGTKNCGETATVVATPNSCYNFVNWTENGQSVSTNLSYSFTVGINRNLVANFTLKQNAITCSASPSGGGSTSGCGTKNCGETATVVATPNSCYNFVNWTENGQSVSTNPSYSFTVSTNRNLVANFIKPDKKLSFSQFDISRGTIEIDGRVYKFKAPNTAIDTSCACGTTINLRAIPGSSNNFVSWSGNLTGSVNPNLIVLDDNKTIAANFDGPNAVEQLESIIPEYFSLKQNHPNPFNPTTNIEFSIPNENFVSVVVCNTLGQEVVSLVNENLNPGVFKTTWDGKNSDGNQVPSGMYFYRIIATPSSGDEPYIETRKMLLLK